MSAFFTLMRHIRLHSSGIMGGERQIFIGPINSGFLLL